MFICKKEINFLYLKKNKKVMEGKLIKINGEYILNPSIVGTKLSLKNCEAIERGYDFDEYGEGVFYAGQFGHPSPEGFSDEQVGRLHGFIDGFQKALELLHDKNFSEGEWMVEVEMEFKDYDFNIETCINHYVDGCKDCYKEFLTPKLDENGCLILKRI